MGGGPVMGAPPRVECWGGLQCGDRRRRSGGKDPRPVGAGGRWRCRAAWARARSDRESGANGWAPLQSQAARATDIRAPGTVPGFEFPKPVNFIQI
jgi:hypothetical protein